MQRATFPKLLFFAGLVLVLVLTMLGSTSPVQAAANDNNVEWNGVGHNTRDTSYRSLYGAVPTGQAITLKLRSYRYDITGAAVRIWNSTLGQEQLYSMSWASNDATYDYWQVTIPAQSTPTVLWYHFRVVDGNDTDYYSDDGSRDGGWGQMFDLENQVSDYNITVYDPNFSTPQWLKDAVIYQIFPDRFYNGSTANDPLSTDKVYGDNVLMHTNWNDLPENPPKGRDFFGGDLAGVTAKLDVLQDLGVTVIYFNPVFSAPSNHLYDTGDYKTIDPYFGDLAAFQTLITEANARGIKVILDGVFNHTSVAHPYFQDVVTNCSASAYWTWYAVSQCPIRWYDDLNRNHTWDSGEPQINWDTPVQGILGSPDYSSWWGFATIPTLSETADVKNYIYNNTDSVQKYWLNQGAAGWRFDVADEVSHTFWQGSRTAIKAANSNAPLIGEVWGDGSEYLVGNEMDSLMNYRFKFALTDFIAKGTSNATTFNNLLAAIQEDYPAPAWYAMMNLIDSHDTARFLNDAGGDKSKLKLAALFQMTYAGAPTIYYGDEVGVTGGNDPDSRRTYPWGSEDLTLRNAYKQLISLRKSYSALRTGNVQHGLLVDDANGGYAFGRDDASNKIVVALNNNAAARTLTINVSGYVANGTMLTDVLNGSATYTVSNGSVSVPVSARWGAVLVAGGSSPTATPTPIPATATPTPIPPTATPTSASVQVTFTEVGYVTYYGQNIFIVGNVPELGNWNTAQAVPLAWVNSNTWSGPVTFTASKGQTIQYKYIVKNPNGSIVWEGGSNHTYTVPTSGSGSRTDNWQP
ncbi:MAG: alpha amylase N-terminal ig-like domain-containing protein [Chloroflexi bacterium]|nr:alpha amylase N-terminal ig-like domain-containing protein [Chloroflexota bacterium]